MGRDAEIKIRTLPRKGEVKKDAPPSSPALTSKRWIIYVGTVAMLLLTATLLWPSDSKRDFSSNAPATKSAPPPKRVRVATYDAVNRHLEDASFKEQIMKQAQEVNNLKVQGSGLQADALASDDDGRAYGVQLDHENTAERVYADLNDDVSGSIYNDILPADRINARLANRRWVNEAERAERIQFVRNYVRSWAERGYEVQIDHNLVVVGLKKISRLQKFNIDQVMDRMAKKGL